MKLHPGDQIQIILTVDKVPYAKTHTLDYFSYDAKELAAWAINELCDDIKEYADEEEIEGR